MANLIDETYFIVPIQIDSSDDNKKAVLNQIITNQEAKYLSLLTYDDGVPVELAAIKLMIGNFSYTAYLEHYENINTSTGNVMQITDGSVNFTDLSYAYEKYNDAVDIFNTYVTLEADKIISYKNALGI